MNHLMVYLLTVLFLNLCLGLNLNIDSLKSIWLSILANQNYTEMLLQYNIQILVASIIFLKQFLASI